MKVIKKEEAMKKAAEGCKEIMKDIVNLEKLATQATEKGISYMEK